MNTEWDDFEDYYSALEELIKKNEKKIKKLKKRIKNIKKEVEGLKEKSYVADCLLSYKNRYLSVSAEELNPISQAYEITLTGIMGTFKNELKFSNEEPNMPYYECEVMVNYPDGNSSKIDGYIWMSTVQNHNYLTEFGSSIGLRIQIVNGNEVYAKVIPLKIDVSKLVDKNLLNTINEGNDFIPLEHQNKWWNRVIVK